MTSEHYRVVFTVRAECQYERRLSVVNGETYRLPDEAPLDAIARWAVEYRWMVIDVIRVEHTFQPLEAEQLSFAL